jgi:hypothetical protein
VLFAEANGSAFLMPFSVERRPAAEVRRRVRRVAPWRLRGGRIVAAPIETPAPR